MNINEVPQDKDDFKGKGQLKRVLYVTQGDGSFTKASFVGWDAENVATHQIWEAIESDLEQIRQRVIHDEISPLFFHMHKHLMDVSMLAKYVQKWGWQVKRHFKPKVFKQLSEATLQKYAQVFNISVSELCSVPSSPITDIAENK